MKSVFCTFAAVFKIYTDVIYQSFVGYPFPASRRHRPRMRVSAYCLSAHLGRMGAGRHRRTRHP